MRPSPKGGVAIATVVALAASMAMTSCKKPNTVPLDGPFELRVGQAAHVAKSDLDLLFRRVASDSRCPRNVTCIHAGEATVTLDGRILKGPSEMFDVTVANEPTPDNDAGRAFDGYRIHVLKLEPFPVGGVATDSTAYVATLLVQKR